MQATFATGAVEKKSSTVVVVPKETKFTGADEKKSSTVVVVPKETKSKVLVDAGAKKKTASYDMELVAEFERVCPSSSSQVLILASIFLTWM